MRTQDGHLHLEDTFDGRHAQTTSVKLTKIAFRKPHGFAIDVPTEFFESVVTQMSRYKSRTTYKERYHLLAIHFFPTETRFICGNGARFVVLTTSSSFARYLHFFIHSAHKGAAALHVRSHGTGTQASPYRISLMSSKYI